jgi:uncharacterized protein YdeI (YjbR/CyaY-like superfamily)
MAQKPSTGIEEESDLPTVNFASRDAWEQWLDREHATSRGVWLQIAKKGAPVGSVSYDEALEVALCYGWIDGQKAAGDETHWLQRFTPRKPRSKWSKINRDRAEALIAQGRMTPAGLREVERAQADGRWDAAYESQSTASIPEDFARELARNPRAEEFFSTLNSANRYAFLYRIHEAKRPETRARRIEKFIAMLNDGKTLHP